MRPDNPDSGKKISTEELDRQLQEAMRRRERREQSWLNRYFNLDNLGPIGVAILLLILGAILGGLGVFG